MKWILIVLLFTKHGLTLTSDGHVGIMAFKATIAQFWPKLAFFVKISAWLAGYSSACQKNSKVARKKEGYAFSVEANIDSRIRLTLLEDKLRWLF